MRAPALLWIGALSIATSGMPASGQARGPRQNLKAEVLNPVARPWDSGDPEILMFRIEFDLRLTNTGTVPSEAGAAPINVYGVQVRRHDGSWSDLTQTSFYDTGERQYAPCSRLDPGKVVTLEKAVAGLTLAKSRWDGLKSDSVFRFNLGLPCQDAPGKIAAPGANSEPITLALPLPRASAVPGEKPR